MAIDQRMDMRQSQQMVMTPQLQQSIKILQLNSIDLFSYISAELEKNPFLSGGEAEEGDSIEEVSKQIQNETNDKDDKTKSIIEGNPGDGWSDDEVSGAVYEDNDSTLNYSGSKNTSHDFSDSNYQLEQTSAPKETLREHVIDQINVDILDPVDRMIALSLTDSMDETGYITVNMEEFADTLKCDVSRVEEVLKKLQTFDPSGIFCRDLSECLKIQLEDRNHYDPAIAKLLDNLDLLAKRDFTKLQKICAVDKEDLRDMVEEIKSLNPKPGNIFTEENIQILQPDIFLKRDSNGNWQLELNSETLPKILVNKKYYAQITSEVGNDKESKKFLSDQLSNASWLVKALHQRANTILKIATEIVQQQDMFFKKGIKHLQPLTLGHIATNIDMHESTVSRVVNGKYIATHMGVFELKYFFTSSIGNSEGRDDLSSRTVKHRIKELIDAEDSAKPLSDDKISKTLKGEGINCARRTVMKYREAMNIASSFERKRMGKGI